MGSQRWPRGHHGGLGVINGDIMVALGVTEVALGSRRGHDGGLGDIMVALGSLWGDGGDAALFPHREKWELWGLRVKPAPWDPQGMRAKWGPMG